MAGDIWWLSTWAKDIIAMPYSNFYNESHARVDLPPILPLIFGAFEYVRHLFYILFSWSVSDELFLKSIFIFFEGMLGLVGFRFFLKRSKKIGIIFLLLFTVNLAFIYDTAIWPQSEAVVTFFILLSFTTLIENKKFSFLFLVLAVLCKPQAAIIIPLYLLFHFNKFGIKQVVFATIGSLAVSILVIVPFLGTNLSVWVEKLGIIFSEYPFTSRGAWNLWSWLVGDRVPDSITILGFSYRNIAIFVFTAAYIVVLFSACRNKSTLEKNIFWYAFLIYFSFFTFSTGITARYSYYSLVFLLFSFCLSRKIFHLFLYLLLMLIFFFNIQASLGTIVIPLALDPKIAGLVISLLSIFLVARLLKNRNERTAFGK
jgi:hypothetical protein